jgi:hypothetical protein
MENAPVSTSSSTPRANPATTPSLIPPEEQFWKRYSPHNEAPLSGVTSFALHLLIIPLLLLIGYVYTLLRPEDENRSLPVDVVRVEIPGGGGNKRAEGPGSGGPQASPMESGGDSTDEDPKKAKPQPLENLVSPEKVQELRAEFNDDPAAKIWIDRGNAQLGALAKLDDDIRKNLRKNVNPGAGRGGSGRDGGKDTGKDTGSGPGKGAGNVKLNQREKRVLRWAMTFNTLNGTDYVNQLHGLGAIVAFPVADKRFKVVRDQKNPGTAKEEDISAINRIYWVDDKPQSVHSLSTALRERAPQFFVAFFPKKLEDRLLKLELDEMQRRFGKRNEDEIYETKFDVVRVGGEYDVKVRNISLRP